MKKFSKIIALLLLLFTACSRQQTDEQLLEKDKILLNKSIHTSRVLPYKFVKIVLRASAGTDTMPPDFKQFDADLKEVHALAMKLDTPGQLSPLDYYAIYRNYKKMSNVLTNTDEDIFPTFTDVLNSAYPDSTRTKASRLQGIEKKETEAVEHAFLSVIAGSVKDPGKEISLYECAETDPEDLNDTELKTLIQYYRGFLFFNKALLYLAEDEYTRNINWLHKNKNVDLAMTRDFFGWTNRDNEKTHTAFLSLNYLCRGFSRLRMERKIDEERALEDLKLFINGCKQIGLNNELSWSYEAYIYMKKEDNDKAIASLLKLKASPLLSSEDKNTIDKSVTYLKKREPGKAMNRLYDKFFLAKIMTSYMMHIVYTINWSQVLKEQNVPHAEELIKMTEKYKKLEEKVNSFRSEDALKDLKSEGNDILQHLKRQKQ